MTIAHWFQNFILDSPIERFALVLMHALWQALLLVNLVALILAALTRARPQYRYMVAIAGMLVLPVFPLVTWTWVEPSRPPEMRILATNTDVLPQHIEIGQDKPKQMVHEATPMWGTDLGEVVDSWCRRYAEWLVVAWGAGISVLAIRLGIAYLSLSRLRREPCLPIPEFISNQLTHLTKRIGVHQTVGLCLTERVDNPAVMGWLRPLILLPARVVTGMSADDLAHILAHELAHVARRDYSLNLFQCMIEMFFFYHPAVWWLSQQVREERECCCDEMAISACGDRYAYARSLTVLDELRPKPRPLVLALGTRGGRLMNRIRRLLGVQSPSAGNSAVICSGLAASTVIALILVSNGVTAQTQEKELATTSRVAATNAVLEPTKAEAQGGDAGNLAELELDLAEAQELEKLATEEFLLAEKMASSGELSQHELLSTQRRQLDGQFRLKRAKSRLDEARGQELDLSSEKLEFDYMGISDRLARRALAEVEKQLAAGEANQLDLLVARREAANAKFQFERFKLKQSQNRVKSPVVVVYRLKHISSDIANRATKDWIELADPAEFHSKDTIRLAIASSSTNSLVIIASDVDHKKIAQKLAELDDGSSTKELAPQVPLQASNDSTQKPSLDFEVQLLELDVKEAESEVANLQQSLERCQSLRAKGVAAESIILEYETSYRKAKFTLERANLKLAAAKAKATAPPIARP